MEDIILSNICKSFSGAPVLRDFSARFPAGAVSCVMAPSGAGKTTLLRILMGLERADSGELSGLEGRRLSAVFQEDRLCPWLSAAENILLVSPALAGARVESALTEMGLGDAAEQSVRELSGGMCRRVALLRALLAEAEILLLDEPFKGLDQETKASVIQVVRKYAAGKTVILVTHDPSEPEALSAVQIITLPALR